jgi:serine/threonine protein kinase/WD40 repeat protein/tetratricopeptide (TPR) repeat protein
MEFDSIGDADFVRRLPLPLAQLYRRAQNAVSPSNRLNTAYCLWESALKLLGSVAIVVYSDRGEHSPVFAERLKNLARPSLGHWWEFSRLLVPALADAGDPGFALSRDLLFGRARDDMPRAAGLDSALRDVLDGHSGARSTVKLAEVFDRMVRFRNQEIGHGPLGQRSAEFQDRMGRALLAGVVEIIGRLDVLAGRRLVYVADVRRDPSGAWLIERFEMRGEASRRLKPLAVPTADAVSLPRPDHVYLETDSNEQGPVLRPLHPLVVCNHEMAEVFFLNARRGSTRAEYLCYHPGRVEERPSLGVEQREFLARVLGLPVDSGQIETWAALSVAEDPPGPVIAAATSRQIGEFELLSELGRGGMGVVYRAWQHSLGRQVALKRLLTAGDAKAEARFMGEIHSLGRVDHPNLVKAYTSGSDGEHWFYAMELVEGATLSAVCETLQESCPHASRVDLETWRVSLSSACEQTRRAERLIVSAEPGDFPRAVEPRPTWVSTSPRSDQSYARHVAELIRQAAGAAHALHEADIVHRDIKPGNIMVTADGRQAVLMDLGLAQLADDSGAKLTKTRQFVGTLRYASPEQIMAVGSVDRRSDVYSLGASLWELLTLRPMFGANDETPWPELARRIQFEEPEPVRRYHIGLRRDLEAIVHKCLAKDPRRRYASAADLAADLQRFLDNESVLARREHLGQRLWRRAWRRPAATILFLLVIAGLAALAVAVPKWNAIQRAAEIEATIEDLLDSEDASAPNMTAIDDSISKLEPLAPERAAIKRKRAAARLAQHIDQEIRSRPSFDPADEARIKGQIGLLASRDVERSKELEQHLALRSRSWHEVARLAPPFDIDQVKRAFDPARVTFEPTDLGPKAPDAAGAPPSGSPIFLPSVVECQGNVELDVTLRAGSWNGGKKVGLLLYDNQWHTGLVRGLAYDQSGETLVILDDQGVVRRWELRDHTATSPPARAGSISLAFGLPSGKDAERAGAIAPGLRDVAIGEAVSEGRSARLGQVVGAVAPAGRAVALARPGGWVTLFSVRAGKLEFVKDFELKGREILSLALARDGKMVAAGASDGTISLLVPASERPAVLSGHFGAVNVLAFNDDGEVLASGGADTKVNLWDVPAKAIKFALPGHEGKVSALAFSRDGRTLASGAFDNTVRLWNLATHSGPTLAGHSAPISAIAFSPDRTTIAVGYSRSVKLWDMLANQPLEELQPQQYALQVLAPRSGRSLGFRSGPSNTMTLGEAVRANRPLVVQLLRDNTLLREQEVNVRASASLDLSARLEEGKLQLEVNQTSVVFQDLFPLGRTAHGVFGLELPPGALIDHLVAKRQRPPERPSLIEQGDALFATGQLAKALDFYRKQQEDPANMPALQEAICKEGVCLEGLGQTEAAIRVFTQLEDKLGDRWPVIAGCRLWHLYLTHNNIEAAWSVYTQLAAKRRLEHISSLVPADIPTAIINAYAPISAYSHVVPDPKLVRDLELAERIARDIRAPVEQQTKIKWFLAQAYHEFGQLDLAEKNYAELLADWRLSPLDQSSVLENYAWLLGILKKDQVALDELDRRIADGGDASHLLFLRRAEVRARRGNWTGARDDIDEYFRRRPADVDITLYQACLVRGFIREALGDRDGARESWRQGYRAASGSPDMSFLPVAIQASLSGDMTDDDARMMYNTVLSRLPNNFAALKIAENLKFNFADIANGLRTTWSTARGHEYARKIAVLDISYSEFHQIQVPLTVAAACRYGAFGGTLVPDDDEVLWTMVQNVYRDFLDHKVDKNTLGLLMGSWVGSPNILTWTFAAPRLRPETRGPLAYVLGARHQQLGKPIDARSFFETARRDSTEGTALRRRAQAALDRLNAAK